MKKHSSNSKRFSILPAFCITLGALLCCAVGLAVVDAGMRAVLYRDTAPAFAAALEEGRLSLWLLGRRFDVAPGGLPALREALESLCAQLRTLLPAPAPAAEVLRRVLFSP